MREDAHVEATTLTDEQTWRDHYGIGRPTELVSELNGREFEAVDYVGYPFDPALEDRPLTIAFVDDAIVVRGVCSSRTARVASKGDTVEHVGEIAFVGVGCTEFDDVDGWQVELVPRVDHLNEAMQVAGIRPCQRGGRRRPTARSPIDNRAGEIVA